MKSAEKIIFKRYSDRDFSKLYFEQARKGLKEFEKKVIKKYLKNAKTLLVIGCGCGREVVPLTKMGYTVTAIDFSPEMVKFTNKFSKENQVKVKCIQMNAKNLKFYKNSFDAVLMLKCFINQIQTHKNRLKVLKEVQRVLKPEGLCVLTSNNALYPGNRFSFWIEHLLHIFKQRNGEFLDRSYNDNDVKVYVHLPTPFYLKRLIKKYFIIKAFSSIFAEELVIVGQNRK
ncbi:MAG: class I SAM-dependent methyltransferase [Nanoarchaeota archaeon]|nr:class I SAM-dependent methyltransferase [Nanoarchaeota archaeon]